MCKIGQKRWHPSPTHVLPSLCIRSHDLPTAFHYRSEISVWRWYTTGPERMSWNPLQTESADEGTHPINSLENWQGRDHTGRDHTSLDHTGALSRSVSGTLKDLAIAQKGDGGEGCHLARSLKMDSVNEIQPP